MTGKADLFNKVIFSNNVKKINNSDQRNEFRDGISLQPVPFKLGKSMTDSKEKKSSNFSNLHECALKYPKKEVHYKF